MRTLTLSDNRFVLWTFSEEEQEELLGSDIGTLHPMVVVELDEASQNQFYNRRFAPLIFKIEDWSDGSSRFKIGIYSIDDAMRQYSWDIRDMSLPFNEAIEKLKEWLQRSNFFVNLRGLEDFLGIFGKYEENHN